MSDVRCPECGKALEWTGSGPEWMNSEQWDASKAGDYFVRCDKAAHPNGNCYFWKQDDGSVRKPLKEQP